MPDDTHEGSRLWHQDGVLPWTRSCFVCGEANPRGMRLRSRVEGDRVVLSYTPVETDLGWRQIVHGGIAMILMDEVMTWAAMLKARRACVAAEMTSRLRRPIRVGQPLRVEGWVSRAASRLFLTGSRILGDGDLVLSEATGKYAPMPSEELSACTEDFVWDAATLDVTGFMQSEPK